LTGSAPLLKGPALRLIPRQEEMAGMAKETKTAAKSEAKPAKPAKAAAAKTGEGTARKVNPALMKPMTPSKELGAVVGTKPIPRTEVVSKVWEYIKSNKLQNPKNGREILADDKLKKVFGVDKVTMFEMNKHLSKHLS
jgi:upstream activation factor subunit UAF30